MAEAERYDPTADPGVARLEELREAGASAKELRSAELALISQSDNRPRPDDPDHGPSPDRDDSP
jgi:hypothetical protein